MRFLSLGSRGLRRLGRSVLTLLELTLESLHLDIFGFRLVGFMIKLWARIRQLWLLLMKIV